MLPSATRLYRRLRFGPPLIVVSGLPRSGTSMAMAMLEAGGLEVLTDGVRTADAGNPKGYYELERVKSLNSDADRSWLVEARGKAIKIISFLLTYLPETNSYTVIFMHRSLDEVVASQNRMLARRAAPADGVSDEQMRRLYAQHLAQVQSLLKVRPCFDVLDVEHADVLANPVEQATRVARFLGRALEVERMAAAVERQLYRTWR